MFIKEIVFIFGLVFALNQPFIISSDQIGNVQTLSQASNNQGFGLKIKDSNLAHSRIKRRILLPQLERDLEDYTKNEKNLISQPNNIPIALRTAILQDLLAQLDSDGEVQNKREFEKNLMMYVNLYLQTNCDAYFALKNSLDNKCLSTSKQGKAYKRENPLDDDDYYFEQNKRFYLPKIGQLQSKVKNQNNEWIKRYYLPKLHKPGKGKN